MSNSGDRRHQRVLELLPWYANDTLEGGERREVEDHLAGCTCCQEELAGSRQLGGELRRAEAVAPSPHPAQLARLLE
nr:zf-HC2 domain-containing protein [Acidobacteriota bacterium]